MAESRPLLHAPPEGARAPGANLVTCIKKKPGISDEEFFECWTVEHRKVAVETQSTFGYVRNEIFRALTPGAPDQWDAFVEESFPMEAMTDQRVFYDSATQEEYEKNFKIMMDSCARFLDHGTIEVTFFSEYYMG